MAPLTPPPARRGERGHVLLIVAVMGLLAMGLWGLAWRGTQDDIRLERFEVRRDERTHTLYPALGAMLDLLRSGRPPTDPYACLVAVTHDGSVHDVTATFASDGDQDHWRVDCRAATPEDLSLLPAAPTSFGP